MAIRRKGSSYYWTDFTVQGQRVRVSTGEKKKFLAAAVEAELRSKARNRGVASIRYAPITLAAYSVDFLRWVDACPRDAGTKLYYKAGWRMLSNTPLAAMYMDQISNRDCEMIKFPGGPYTANTALKTLRRILNMAHEDKQLFEVPLIRMRKEVGRSIIMDEASAEKIAAFLDGDSRDVLFVLSGTGMRPSEAFRMRWEHIQWPASVYKNPYGKTASSARPIPLLGRSLEVLQRRRIEQGMPNEGWVFPSRSSSGRVTTIQKKFMAARKLAGYPDGMVLYCARHGVATRLADALPTKMVMEILGHSDAKTAMGYQHHSIEGIKERIEKGRIQ